ncbi:3D (Asp-Asp-Asp) domain-containing protein [Algoriphagus yeomjeoni]|uniref:3D (Asp-Asp-Asp) domain-containing protein n=2 Tax=Algoriphagus yeomjeoni TaxID=291403 RepID=A0A327P104_9BACT|nr:3D (Asp-Asp-Asp) domain-containing protein [Algoriphagus yeomjeoni]
MCQPLKNIQILAILIIFFVSSCSKPKTKSMEVVATAYNSVTAQTDGDPSITAWGDTLEPGMKAVAISRDLLDSGLYYNMDITIEGLEGRYKVLDKMNRRWVNKIDIYMGLNVLEARQWGKQYVTISYRPSE